MKHLLHNLAAFLVTIAAINWGLVGLFNINIVHSLFGTMPMVEKYVYVAIGLAGLVFAAVEASEHKHY